MIPYMVGKLAPNSTHSTRGLVKYVPGRGYYRGVPSQNGDKFVTSPPPSIVERVLPASENELRPYVFLVKQLSLARANSWCEFRSLHLAVLYCRRASNLCGERQRVPFTPRSGYPNSLRSFRRAPACSGHTCFKESNYPLPCANS